MAEDVVVMLVVNAVAVLMIDVAILAYVVVAMEPKVVQLKVAELMLAKYTYSQYLEKSPIFQAQRMHDDVSGDFQSQLGLFVLPAGVERKMS